MLRLTRREIEKNFHRIEKILASPAAAAACTGSEWIQDAPDPAM